MTDAEGKKEDEHDDEKDTSPAAKQGATSHGAAFNNSLETNPHQTEGHENTISCYTFVFTEISKMQLPCEQ